MQNRRLLNNFEEDILRKKAEDVSLSIEVDGVTIPVKIKFGAPEADTVMFLFHGAVDRTTRPVPAYAPFMPGLNKHAHQVSISDPSILALDGFGLSWYAGYEGFDSQTILRELIEDIATLLEAKRLLFFGSSGGGFASLFYSWHFDESVCVCPSPQTDMRTYYSGHIKRYRENCWPSVATDAELAETICTNVADLYEKKVPNLVVYLQSAGDHFHLKTQYAPFINRINVDLRASKLVTECSFWGKLGHSGSVPQFAFLPWLKAAIVSGGTKADDILLSHHIMQQRDDGASAKRAPEKVREHGAAASGVDGMTARLLSNWLLENR